MAYVELEPDKNRVVPGRWWAWHDESRSTFHTSGSFGCPKDGFPTLEEAQRWGGNEGYTYKFEADPPVTPQPPTEIIMCYGVRNKIDPVGATFTFATLEEVSDFFLRHPDWVDMYVVDELVRRKTLTAALRTPPTTPYVVFKEVTP